MLTKDSSEERLDGLLGSTQDSQSVTADWQPLQQLIEGVQVKEIRSVIKSGGDVLTEIFRPDWGPDIGPVEHVFQAVMNPGSISGWHAHRAATDRLFVSHGVILIVLYDARPESPSFGRINEFRFGSVRPGLVTIPPGVWHAVRNLAPGISTLINLPDRPYHYEKPDHWRLPIDTDKIPYSFHGSKVTGF